MLLGLDVREDAASNARAENAGMSLQAPPGHPARGRFLVSRQVSWLAGRRYPRVFPMRCRISDFKIREQLTAYSCGGSAGFSRLFARSPASLLATMTCAVMDRDNYIWCDLNNRVNGAQALRAKIPVRPVEAVNNHNDSPQPAIELTHAPRCR